MAWGAAKTVEVRERKEMAGMVTADFIVMEIRKIERNLRNEDNSVVGEVVVVVVGLVVWLWVLRVECSYAFMRLLIR